MNQDFLSTIVAHDGTRQRSVYPTNATRLGRGSNTSYLYAANSSITEGEVTVSRYWTPSVRKRSEDAREYIYHPDTEIIIGFKCREYWSWHFLNENALNIYAQVTEPIIYEVGSDEENEKICEFFGNIVRRWARHSNGGRSQAEVDYMIEKLAHVHESLESIFGVIDDSDWFDMISNFRDYVNNGGYFFGSYALNKDDVRTHLARSIDRANQMKIEHDKISKRISTYDPARAMRLCRNIGDVADVRVTDKGIWFLLEPINIDYGEMRYRMGSYAIKISSIGDIRVIGVKDNVIIANRFSHPYVSNMVPCLGNIRSLVENARAGGDFFSIILLCSQLLGSYSPKNAPWRSISMLGSRATRIEQDTVSA